MILAIDPGSTESGVVLMDAKTYEPINIGIMDNESFVKTFVLPRSARKIEAVIEMVAHYGTGMPAGADVFDTCVWIGRFIQKFYYMGVSVTLIKRQEVKLNLCESPRAKDSNVIQALVDRFAKGEKNYGKGTTKERGYFYGFHADIWQAYALGVTHLDNKKKKK